MGEKLANGKKRNEVTVIDGLSRLARLESNEKQMETPEFLQYSHCTLGSVHHTLFSNSLFQRA